MIALLAFKIIWMPLSMWVYILHEWLSCQVTLVMLCLDVDCLAAPLDQQFNTRCSPVSWSKRLMSLLDAISPKRHSNNIIYRPPFSNSLARYQVLTLNLDTSNESIRVLIY